MIVRTLVFVHRAGKSAFLGASRVIIATPLKREAANARPVLAAKDFASANRLAEHLVCRQCVVLVASGRAWLARIAHGCAALLIYEQRSSVPRRI
ncbi:hypothetical protein OG216_22940 [Streptomycetaceae bacterium NBC_01309]